MCHYVNTSIVSQHALLLTDDHATALTLTPDPLGTGRHHEAPAALAPPPALGRGPPPAIGGVTMTAIGGAIEVSEIDGGLGMRGTETGVGGGTTTMITAGRASESSTLPRPLSYFSPLSALCSGGVCVRIDTLVLHVCAFRTGEHRFAEAGTVFHQCTR